MMGGGGMRKDARGQGERTRLEKGNGPECGESGEWTRGEEGMDLRGRGEPLALVPPPAGARSRPVCAGRAACGKSPDRAAQASQGRCQAVPRQLRPGRRCAPAAMSSGRRINWRRGRYGRPPLRPLGRRLASGRRLSLRSAGQRPAAAAPPCTRIPDAGRGVRILRP